VAIKFEGGFERTLEAAQSGADWAWETIYTETAPRVLSYLRANRAPDPDDLLGEVFLQAVRDLESFRGGERDLRAWLLTIAHHRLIDARRRAARRPEVPGSEALEAVGPIGDVEREALERLGGERVRALLDLLTEEQRAVLLLRIVGDLSVDQVAQALGRRPGAIKQLQRRGLLAVRRVLEREGVAW
jgi:RNA polymerase sigma-70 factor (ECF subfamily)